MGTDRELVCICGYREQVGDEFDVLPSEGDTHQWQCSECKALWQVYPTGGMYLQP